MVLLDLEGDGLPCNTYPVGEAAVGATEPHCVDCCRRLGIVPKLAFTVESHVTSVEKASN